MLRASTGRSPAVRFLGAFLAILLGAGMPGPGLNAFASEPDAAESGSTALSVVSEPAGAAVYVNGRLAGETPLSVKGVEPGEHRVRLVKQGYLENSQRVSVKAGRGEKVRVSMTRSGGTTRHALQQDPDTGGGGGGKALWIVLGIAAVGAGAYFLLRDKNDPPTAALQIDAGGTALQGATSVRFSSGGSNDPDGDALTSTWNFGDGSSGSGAEATHVYNTAGAFTVTLTVSDGEASATATGTVTVRNLTAIWIGNIGGANFLGFNLTHNGSSITGVYADSVNGSGPATGSVSAPRNVTLRHNIQGFRTGNWSGSVSEDVNTITGTVDWFQGGIRNFTLRRQ